MEYSVRPHAVINGAKKLEVIKQWDKEGETQQANYIFTVSEDINELASSFNAAIHHLASCKESSVTAKT